MKKSEQYQINAICNNEREKALYELEKECNTINGVECRRLRTCSAKVYSTSNYYILQSYNTIIAVIGKNTDTLYDFLRIAYGYTNTSAQHIAKFNHDYCSGSWNCSKVYTAR